MDKDMEKLLTVIADELFIAKEPKKRTKKILGNHVLIKEYEKENGLYGAVELDLYKSGKITKEEFKGAITIYAKDYRERLNKML